MRTTAAMRRLVLLNRSEWQWGRWFAVGSFLGFMVVIGCDRQRPAVVELNLAQDAPTQSQSSLPDVKVRLHRRVFVMTVTESGPLTASRIAGSLGAGLTKRGIESFGGHQPDERDLVILARAAMREGAVWGGMSSREVLLECRLYDVRESSPLVAVFESARQVERSEDDAAMGALKKAADKAADRIVRWMINMPEELRTAPPGAPSTNHEAIGLACLPFHNGSGQRELDGWCSTLASLVAAAYQKSGRFVIRERARLGDLVGEQDVVAVLGGNTGAAKQLGDNLDVSQLVVGEVAFRPDGALVVTARQVRVDDSGVEQVFVVTGSRQRVEELEQALLKRVKRSMLGWIADRIDQVEQMPVAWPKDALAPR